MGTSDPKGALLQPEGWFGEGTLQILASLSPGAEWRIVRGIWQRWVLQLDNHGCWTLQ